MFSKRFWRGFTIISYWHKGIRYAITMTGKFSGLDEMAETLSKYPDTWYSLHITQKSSRTVYARN